MVSVIIPAYNCEEYIESCVQSLLQQDYSDIEIIIVNDGSIDCTSKILADIAAEDNRIRVFHIDNRGPSHARNIGLDYAKGDWVLFVDSDDWVDTNILSRLNLSNNAADIIFFGFKKCYNNRPIEKCIPSAADFTDIPESINRQLLLLFNSKDEYFGYSVNKIYRRSIIEEHNIRFKESLSVREDEVFALNYCQFINSIQTISFAPYNYRILSNSLSHNKLIRFRNYQFLIETEKEILVSYNDSIFKEAVYARLYQYYLASIVECLYMKKPDIKEVISNSITYYAAHHHYIKATWWQKFIFGFPIKFVGELLVYIVFTLRNKISL